VTTDPAGKPAKGRGLEYSALWQLTRARIVTFVREPEALFWVFAFPVLMALALGIAFRNQGPQLSRVGVERGPAAVATAGALERSPDLEVVLIDPAEAATALRRGRIAVLVRIPDDGIPELVYDPTRPETRLAHLATIDALERGAGRVDTLTVRSDTQVQPGSRYIDFLIPGLIGLNLLGTGMWAIGFAIANARQQGLLKRMIATPMRKGHYLLAFMLSRLVWLVLEVAAVQSFGWFAFGVAMRGSWAGYVVVCLTSALTFSALGLLVASRTRTIEGASGLMNFVMMPMWLLSGVFFSSERFPGAMQPLIKALPLTATNDALRLLGNEGATLVAVAPQVAVITLWGVVSFVVALRLFRWH
jgi:ABC-type multidrug transport system permease subunit